MTSRYCAGICQYGKGCIAESAPALQDKNWSSQRSKKRL